MDNAKEQGHTPIPYEIGIKDRKGCGIIYGFNRIPILIYDANTKEEDVKFIVDACNSHDRLTAEVEMLRTALQAIINFPYGVSIGDLESAHKALSITEKEGK